MDKLNEQQTGVQSAIFLLQTDPCVAVEDSQSKIVPLQILDKNYQSYICEQYIVPFSQTRLGEEQENLQVFLNNHNEPVKIISVGVENNLLIKQNDVIIQESASAPTSHASTNIPNLSVINKEINNSVKHDRLKIQNYVHIPDRVAAPRALAVLPAALRLRRMAPAHAPAAAHAHAVAPRRALPPRVRFGPVQGVKRKISQLKANELVLQAALAKLPFYLLKEEDGYCTHIDVSDKDKSNWFSLMPLGDQSTANVWLYEENNELYGITMESIPSRRPLAIGYSKTFADDHGLPDGLPVLDLNEECSVGTNRLWCYECRRQMASADMLQRHVVLHLKEQRTAPRHRYCCKQCTRTFSRLFTLKRHTRRYCAKKTDNTTNTVNPEPVMDAGLNCSQNTEDNRIPSDESFQQYTNGLDFSTNLFDDRMPTLDMSGSSRSECDFNLYVPNNKHENVLPSDILTKFSDGLDVHHNSPAKERPKSVAQTESCPHCNQIVAKEKKRRHVRVCPARRHECECGSVFTNKKLLTEHIYTEHSTDVTSKTSANESHGKKSYACEKCKYSFKRRGMLVNHLWRAHGAAPAAGAVPLEKRVRHYLCVACPKVYRSAAKRNHHVRVHHPGAEELRAQTIEGGVRACEPAACAACPRQYASRAKLLQHVRKDHPHLALPVNKRTKRKPNNVKNRNTSRAGQRRSNSNDFDEV